MVIDGSQLLILVKEVILHIGLLFVATELSVKLLLNLTLPNIENALLHGWQLFCQNVRPASLKKRVENNPQLLHAIVMPEELLGSCILLHAGHDRFCEIPLKIGKCAKRTGRTRPFCHPIRFIQVVLNGSSSVIGCRSRRGESNKPKKRKMGDESNNEKEMHSHSTKQNE